jgi:hypothetical protein
LLPWYLVSGILVWLVTTGLRRLKIPRWSLLAAVVVVIAVGAVAHASAVVLLGSFFFFAVLAGTVGAAFAARRGTPGEGDITTAIIAGYAIGQSIVKFL